MKMGRVFKRQEKWWIDFKDAEGRRKRMPIGLDRKLAEQALISYTGRVARQEHLGLVEDSKISFADFAAEWLRRIDPTLKEMSRRRWEGIVRVHLEPHFRGALRAVNSAKAEAYKAARLEAGANPWSINAELTVLRHLMIRATEWGFLSRNPLRDVQGRPAAGIRALPTPKGRVRYLEMDEIARLLDACVDPNLHAFVTVALETGMRKSEVLGLKANAIDWKGGTTIVTGRKNGEDLVVHLNAAALTALKSIDPQPVAEGLFFPRYAAVVNTLHNQFKAACAAAEIKNFRIHDLRHTVGSQHAINGTPQSVIQKILGHKNAKSTEIYMNVAAQHVKKAVEGLSLTGSAK